MKRVCDAERRLQWWLLTLAVTAIPAEVTPARMLELADNAGIAVYSQQLAQSGDRDVRLRPMTYLDSVAKVESQ